jgi:hypothetical protein
MPRGCARTREALFSDKVGRSNCVILRESCRTGPFAFPPLTRSPAHVCGEIAQHREIFEMVRFPLGSLPQENEGGW